MPTPMTQGQRIREIRIDHRYTQEYVAAKLGTTKQSIYKYEADLIKNIPTDRLIQLSQLFNCSAAWLQGLSTVRGTPEITKPMIELDTPPSEPRHEPDPNTPDDYFAFYRNLMDVLFRLDQPQRENVLLYARLLETHAALDALTEE